MKYDLSTPLTSLDGAVMLNVASEPMTVRGALVMALDSQPIETDPRDGSRRQRPIMMSEVRERLAIEALFPAMDADDQTIRLEAEDVALVQKLVLESLPAHVGKFVVRFFSQSGLPDEEVASAPRPEA